MAEGRMDLGGGGRRRGREAAGDEPNVSYEFITPEIAKTYLTQNINNRNISKRHKDRLVRDMNAGHWPDFTGQVIRFNGNGELIDGAHTLSALIEANYSIHALVVRDLPLIVQKKIDQQLPRRFFDNLVIDKFVKPRSVAAAIRVMYRLKHRRVSKGYGAPTNSELDTILERHPRIIDSVEAVQDLPVGVPPSMITAMHYIGGRMLRDGDTADSFVSVFATGNSAFVGDAAHLWRERLMKRHADGETVPLLKLLDGTVHAWNHFAKRTPLERFRIPDEPPVIDGLDLDRI